MKEFAHWIIIALLCVLVIAVLILIFWGKHNERRITALSYSMLPGLDVSGSDLYNDTLPVSEAMNRCSADASCAGFITAYAGQNYYKSNVKNTVPPKPDSDSVLYSKQVLCPE